MTAPNLMPIPELYVSHDSAQKLKHTAAGLISWDLTPRQVCDLELLMNGGFAPLKGFLSQADYDGVVENMRLADGTLWPMPITLDVSEEFAAKVEPGQDIALRDAEGVILAIMSLGDKWVPNKPREAEQVFGADDLAHPAVNFCITPQAKYIWVALSPASSRQFTMISAVGATRPTNCAPPSASLAGAALWHFKPATHCTAPIRN